MKSSFTAFFLFLFLSQSLLTKTNAQDDCCGLGSMMSLVLTSGIHGGYGFQQFSAEGFNHYIKVFNEDPNKNFSQKMDEFGFATGFKFGVNLFQFLVDDWVIGMKLSYHILKEQHEATAGLPTFETETREYKLTYKSFHTGVSFAYYVSKHLDIKVADLMVTFNSADLEMKEILTNQPTTEKNLTSVENPIGFNASAGFTFYIIPPYISIEGTVGYSLFSIDEMEFENGSRLQVDENSGEAMTNFIDGGGLYGFAQLNIAIPFN